MVYSKPLNILVVLAVFLFDKGNSLLGDWSFFKLTADSIGTSIINAQEANTAISADDSNNLDSYVGCSSTSLDGTQTWSFTADVSTLIGSSQYVFGFWVNFESTISEKVFQFGSGTGPYYIVSSTENGTLKVSFFSASGTNDPTNDYSFTVPLSNFYTDKWLFIAFKFQDDSSSVTTEIILSGHENVPGSGSSTVAFAMPGGRFYFGYKIKAKFHRVYLSDNAAIDIGKTDVILNDASGTSFISQACPAYANCIDSTCPMSFSGLNGPKCLSLIQYCSACTASGCTTCVPDSAREETAYCQFCKYDGYINELKNYHCCAKALKCAECSKKSTQCDACAAGYFLNEDSATSTSCLSCADSCTKCEKAPECYSCAEAITKAGTTCRTDSVGYQISLEVPNIVLNFANPLKTGLSESSFVATSSSGASIPTGTWTFSGCTVGLKQCKINAPNVQESDLPIDIDFEFNLA